MSVTAIATLLVGPIAQLINKVVPDKDKAAALAFDIATLAEKQAHEQILAQIAVNQAESSHPSLFVSGWRPAVGWVCVISMGFNYVVIPFTTPLVQFLGFDAVAPLPLDTMLPVLLGMLGLGGMRSYEKRNGVARVN